MSRVPRKGKRNVFFLSFFLSFSFFSFPFPFPFPYAMERDGYAATATAATATARETERLTILGEQRRDVGQKLGRAAPRDARRAACTVAPRPGRAPKPAATGAKGGQPPPPPLAPPTPPTANRHEDTTRRVLYISRGSIGSIGDFNGADRKEGFEPRLALRTPRNFSLPFSLFKFLLFFYTYIYICILVSLFARFFNTSSHGRGIIPSEKERKKGKEKLLINSSIRTLFPRFVRARDRKEIFSCVRNE